MAFQEQFCDPNIHDHLTERLYSLRQTQSVRKYASDFENLARKIVQPHSTWGNIFYRGLKDNVKDLLVGIPCRKSNYKQLKRAALEADERWVSRRGENQNCSIVSHPHTIPNTINPTIRPASSPTAPVPPCCAGPLSQEEKDCHRSLKLCLYCGGSGHIATSCPAKVSRPQLNATSNPLSDEHVTLTTQDQDSGKV